MPVRRGNDMLHEQDSLRKRLIRNIKSAREDIQRHNLHSNYNVAVYVEDLQKYAEKSKELDNAAVKLAAEELLKAIKEVQGFRKTKKALRKPTQKLLSALECYTIVYC